MPNTATQPIKDWCKKHLTQEIVNAMDSGQESAVTLFKQFAGEGLLEFANPGAGMDVVHNLIDASKIFAAYSGDFANITMVNCLGATLLNLFGSDRQKEIADEIIKGKTLFCFSLTEPNAGSDIQNLKTSAQKQNGQWVLNGHKYFASGAYDADVILIVARSNPDQALNRGISLFLMPKNASGVEVIPQKKIASNGFPSCEILLNSVPVEDEMLVGGQDAGWGTIAFIGALERLLVAAACVGLSQRILHYIYEYTQQRRIESRPLYEIQWVNHKIADMATSIKAADLLVQNAANLICSGANPAIEICGAKAFASEMQQDVTMSAMKIIGGRGYLKDHPVERWMREGLLSLYAGGTNELQKNLIARKLPGVLSQMEY